MHVEAGTAHSAEYVLRHALRNIPTDTLRYVSEVVRSEKAHAADLIECLGRLDPPGNSRWRANLLRAALASDDVEVRDAAVSAAEQWEDPACYAVLMSHDDPDPFIADYVEGVLSDRRAVPEANAPSERA